MGPVAECHLEQPERVSEGARTAAETSWAQAGFGHTQLPTPGHGQQEQLSSREGHNFITMPDDSVAVWESSSHNLNLKCVLLAEPVSNNRTQ